MDRDVNAFRLRFKAYKEGKPVSEIYDAGLPKYAGGTPGELSWHNVAADLLDRFEGFRDSVYLDGKGIPTIGYGFTNSALVNKGTITKKEAQKVLKKEISSRGNRVRNIMGAEKWDKLNDNTKAALLSYYYNYPAGFADTTKMMNAWRKGDYNEFVRQIDAGMNDKANPGLKDRRLEEQRIVKEDPFLFPVQEKFLDTTVAKYNAAHLFLPWENYHQPDYPLNNPAPSSISSWNNPKSPAYTPAGLQTRRIDFGKIMMDMLEDDWEPPTIQQLKTVAPPDSKISTFTGFKNGKLPGYKIGHNVSNAKLNEDGTFTDDYTKVFEDMYVTPQKTDLKRGSYTLNNLPYYLQHRTDWMKPLNIAPAEKGLELVSPEFDILLGGRQLVTDLIPSVVRPTANTSSITGAATKNPFKSEANKDIVDMFTKMKKFLITQALSKTKSDPVDIANDPYGIRNLSSGVIHHEGMPPGVEDIFRYQILPRTNISKMNYDNTIDMLSRYGYNTLDDYNWAKYVDDNLAGYLDNSTYGIALREPYIRTAGPHEFRHRMLNLVPYKRSLAIDREAYLNRAYDEDFVNLPNVVDESDSLHGYLRMADEKATTNLDARNYAFANFADDPNLGKMSVTELNKFLDSLSDDLILEAVANSNGYGHKYIHFLEKKYDMLNNPKTNAQWANKFRNAMKYYGSFALPTAIVASLPEYSNGKSPIHIKPANRGKFTALKKRTGHSASWFKENGTPEQKKMAVFALNAKKWKH